MPLVLIGVLMFFPALENDRPALVREVAAALESSIDREVLVSNVMRMAQPMIQTAARETASPEQVVPVEREISNRVLGVIRSFFQSGEFSRNVLQGWVDESFTTAELTDIATFARTAAGRKFISRLAGSNGPLTERTAGVLQEEVVRAVAGARADEMLGLSKIKRTAADIRTLAVALEAYATGAGGRYPAVRSLDELQAVLSPAYVKRMPRSDAWGNPLRVLISDDGTQYRIISGGADGVVDSRNEAIAQNEEWYEGDDATADLVFQNGRFVVTPRSLRPLVSRP